MPLVLERAFDRRVVYRGTLNVVSQLMLMLVEAGGSYAILLDGTFDRATADGHVERVEMRTWDGWYGGGSAVEELIVRAWHGEAAAAEMLAIEMAECWCAERWPAEDQSQSSVLREAFAEAEMRLAQR